MVLPDRKNHAPHPVRCAHHLPRIAPPARGKAWNVRRLRRHGVICLTDAEISAKLYSKIECLYKEGKRLWQMA